jgi:hypothetical protein
MEIQFKNKSAFDVASTYFSGNDYKFTSYVDELAMRFFYPIPFSDALSALTEKSINLGVDYSIHETVNNLPDISHV